MDFNPTAVHFDQTTDQIQPDSQPILRPFFRSVDLRKHIENLGYHVSGDAITIIPDFKDHIATFLFDDHPDMTTLRRELGTVVKKVYEYLSQSGPIGLYIDWPGRYRDSEFVAQGCDVRPA